MSIILVFFLVLIVVTIIAVILDSRGINVPAAVSNLVVAVVFFVLSPAYPALAVWSVIFAIFAGLSLLGQNRQYAH